jgi:hypothetical protein
MSQFMGLSWSTDITMGKSTQPPKSTELVALDLYDSFQLPNNQTLIHGRTTQKVALLDSNALPLLSNFQFLRTKEDHVQAILKQFPDIKNNSEHVIQLINALGQAGLLIKASHLLKKLAISKHQILANTKVNIFIITCDRPTALKRLVDSLPRLDTDKFSLTIIDDSYSTANSQQNQQITYNSPFDIRYFGSEDQSKLRVQLISALPHAESSINFLLKGDERDNRATYGRARNFALLLSAKERLIIVDDDVICHAYNPPQLTSEIRVSSECRDADFYTQDEQWSHFIAKDRNIFVEHSRYLGTDLAILLTDSKSKDTQNSVTNLHIADLLSFDHNSKIISTLNGTYGDPGTSSLDWVFTLNQKTKKRLFSSQDKLSSAFETRNCWLGRTSVTLCTNYAQMSAITGIDNTQLIPPYYPKGRNEDFLSGELLQYIHPNNPALDLPYAVPHLPTTARKWKQDAFKNPISSGMHYFLGNTLRQSRNELATLQSTEKRMQKAASLFTDLADMSSETLSNSIYNHTVSLRSSTIALLNRQLILDDNPNIYNCALKEFIAANSKSLAHIDIRDAIDGTNKMSRSESLDFLRFCCEMFGTAMLHWNEITTCAYQLYNGQKK